MGAINYGTSEYITIGLKPYDYSDYEFYSDSRGDYVVDHESMQMDYETDYENIQYILNKYDFRIFNVSIVSGYYEGFYINIACDNGIVFDCYADKLEAVKELTQVKKFLNECVDNGLCEVWPGWCTSYKDWKQSKIDINAAIQKAKQEIKETPTWFVYNRMGIEA